MSNTENNEKVLITLIKEAFKLEYGTKAGKYNVFFTAGLILLVIAYIATEPFLAAIYAIFLKQQYSGLSFLWYISPPVIWGTACFLYMVFIADNKRKVKSAVDKVKKQQIA